jgi:hypothetical protein
MYGVGEIKGHVDDVICDSSMAANCNIDTLLTREPPLNLSNIMNFFFKKKK